jgi:hypothetical protein
VLYHNDGGDNFTDVTTAAGLGEVTLPFLGWGTSFLDFDNDGWLDLVVANGHVYPAVDEHQWGTSYAQQSLLFRNLKNGKFERVGAAPGSALAAAASGRGLAVADLYGDGRPDVVINNSDSKPGVLKNVAAGTGHWLALRLVGDPEKKSPRDATGAVVYVTTGKVRQPKDENSGGGYASQNDMTLHFGLGGANAVDKIEIRWPDGTLENVSVPGVVRRLTVIEGKGAVK